MSTVSEIEVALTSLTVEELQHLEAALQAALKRRAATGVRTARDAGDWWEKANFFSPTEAEAFARDIEEGRALANQPPPDRWE